MFVTSRTLIQPADLRKNFHLARGKKLFQAQPADPEKLVLLDFSNGFEILTNFSSAGNFDSIKIKASNQINSIEHSFSVTFGKEGDDSEIKWYIIVIIVAVVILGLGLGVGFYIRKRNQKKKNVSLLTEGDEV